MALSPDLNVYEYLYCILPGGNAEEFPELAAEMAKRGIAAEWLALDGDGRVFRVSRADFAKLPVDPENKEPYFGDDESGHGLHHISVAMFARWQKDGRAGDYWNAFV